MVRILNFHFLNVFLIKLFSFSFSENRLGRFGACLFMGWLYAQRAKTTCTRAHWSKGKMKIFLENVFFIFFVNIIIFCWQVYHMNNSWCFWYFVLVLIFLLGKGGKYYFLLWNSVGKVKKELVITFSNIWNLVCLHHLNRIATHNFHFWREKNIPENKEVAVISSKFRHFI